MVKQVRHGLPVSSLNHLELLAALQIAVLSCSLAVHVQHLLTFASQARASQAYMREADDDGTGAETRLVASGDLAPEGCCLAEDATMAQIVCVCFGNCPGRREVGALAFAR